MAIKFWSNLKKAKFYLYLSNIYMQREQGKMVALGEEWLKKNFAVCVRTWTVNVNTFSTTSIICLEIEITVKDEILERW